MGTVYKARDKQLDRFVALKLLRRDLGGEEDHKARLQEEARIAAAVNHPYVIQVFDSGTDHGQFYVVMELVDQGSLDDLMALQPRLPEKRVLEIGIQVAKGLRAAHRRGLIHRDVKPANILFVDEHAAKIGDFGLASSATQRWGMGGVVWGTPEYVAPERLNNDPRTSAATFTVWAQHSFTRLRANRQSKPAQIPRPHCSNQNNDHSICRRPRRTFLRRRRRFCSE